MFRRILTDKKSGKQKKSKSYCHHPVRSHRTRTCAKFHGLNQKTAWTFAGWVRKLYVLNMNQSVVVSRFLFFAKYERATTSIRGSPSCDPKHDDRCGTALPRR